MTDYLSEWNKYLEGTIAEEHFRAKTEFVRLQPAQRIDILGRWDAAIADSLAEKRMPTREDAELVQKRREFADLHWQLTKVHR